MGGRTVSTLFDSKMLPIDLRPYQSKACGMIAHSMKTGHRAPLMVAPTGSGKTTIAAAVIQQCTNAGHRSLFLAPRRELIYQASNRFRAANMPHGVIMAGTEYLEAHDEPIQVGSIDTLISRIFRQETPMEVQQYRLVIVDECHLAVTQRRKDLLALWPEAIILGLTATPIRKDGRALGLLFDDMLQPTSVTELTEQGYLCPARYFSLSAPDLAKIRTVAGDYNTGDLEEAVMKAELVGDIVQTWLEHAGGRPTVVFCTTIKHSVAVNEAFQRAGVKSEHVDAGTPTDERAAIFERYTKGETQVLTNCFLASYGFDYPELSCVVLARPTKSLMLYLQMIGRGLRIAPGKTDCLVLDHSGAVHMHGFADTEQFWSLNGHNNLQSQKKVDEAKEEAKPIECPECHAMFTKSIVCPECGYRLKPFAKPVEVHDGKLIELNKKERGAQLDEQRDFYRQLLGTAQDRGKSTGWAAAMYRQKYNEWPPFPWNDFPPCSASESTLRWIKSRQIAYAKQMQKEKAG